MSAYPDLAENVAGSRNISNLPRPSLFLTIPREMRDMIYSALISSGDPTILQVCQQVHDEAKDVLDKKGFCKLRLFDTPNDHVASIAHLSRLRHLPDEIQNFDLEISIQGSDSRRGEDKCEICSPKWQNLLQRTGSCHITLLSAWSWTISPPNLILPLLKSLSTFKLVTLRIHTAVPFHPMDRRNIDVKPDHTRTLESLAASLSISLGDPQWKTDTFIDVEYDKSWYYEAYPPVNPFPGAQYLEFHPLEAREKAGGVEK